MLQLYICSHHQAGYGSLNKRTIKYNTIKLCGRDLVFTSMYSAIVEKKIFKDYL